MKGPDILKVISSSWFKSVRHPSFCPDSILVNAASYEVQGGSIPHMGLHNHEMTLEKKGYIWEAVTPFK